MKITGNEPAYPTTPIVTSEYNQNGTIKMMQTSPAYLGITILTELAARAMVGLLGNPKYNDYPLSDIAKDAVMCAYALIEELNKEKP